jgi:hypothetical protein
MEKIIKNFIYYIKNNLLIIVFGVLFALFLFYIFSIRFRCFLLISNIDPNFIVVFITALTLIFSAIENKKERKYNFNLNLKNSVEEKALLVIGKLFVMMNESQIYLQTIKNIKSAIKEGEEFIDLNNVLSLEHIKKDRELVGAYITTYFSPYILDDWNLMEEKINKIINNCSVVLIDYNESRSPIVRESFQSEALSKIDNTINESQELDKEIYKLTEKMKNVLLGILKENDKNLKEKYIS